MGDVYRLGFMPPDVDIGPNYAQRATARCYYGACKEFEALLELVKNIPGLIKPHFGARGMPHGA